MQQRETTLVGNPFTALLRHRGWLVTKTHGNAFQKAFPDTRIAHKKFGCRWVEHKVIDRTPKGTAQVHLTQAQKDIWPLWIAYGESIFVVAAEDLRGVANKQLMEKWYNRVLYGEPNCHFFLNSTTVKYGIIP